MSRARELWQSLDRTEAAAKAVLDECSCNKFAPCPTCKLVMTAQAKFREAIELFNGVAKVPD